MLEPQTRLQTLVSYINLKQLDMVEREVAALVNTDALTRAKLTGASAEVLGNIDKMVKAEQEQMIILKAVIKKASDLYFAETEKPEAEAK